MSRLRVYFVLMLIVGSSLVEAEGSADKVEDDESAEDDGVKNKRMEDSGEEDKGVKEESEEQEADESDEVSKEEILTKASCMDALNSPNLSEMCCHRQLEQDEDTQICAERERKNRYNFSVRELAVHIVECIFKRKKYLKSRNRLNMKHIERDAAKLNDTVKGEFMINMYRTCHQKSITGVESLKHRDYGIKTNAQAIHESYMFLLFTCVNQYFMQHSCPYFHWFGRSSANQAKCKQYANECKKLVT